MGSQNVDDLERVATIVMVETARGLENLEAIAATPGVDAIYVGPADLALAVGLPPGFDREEPEHSEAIDRILKACKNNGIVAGIQCNDGTLAARRVAQGFQMVTVANEAALLKSAAARELQVARGDASAGGIGAY